MKRREFITLLGGAAATWPLAARAQQPSGCGASACSCPRPRTIRKRRPASRRSCRGCSKLGWTDGRNVRIDYRWAAGDADAFADTRRNWSRSRRTSSWPLAPSTVGALLQATRTVPIVFVGRRRSGRRRLRRQPGAAGRQRHGFMQFEYSMSGKWLELLKEIAPGVTRAAVLRDPAIPAGIGQFAAIQAVAPSLGVEVEPGQRARRRRDRARRRGLRALAEWRPDRDGERVGGGSSRSDHRAGGPAQAARGLLSIASSSPPAA